MIPQRFYGTIMTFWLTLFNGITVSTVMIYANTGTLIPLAIFVSSLEAWVIGFVADSIFHVAPFGTRIAKQTFHTRPGSVLFILISSIPICVVMALVLTFAFALINVGFSAAFLAAWFGSVPLAFLVSYLTSVLLTPLITRLSDLLTRVR